MKKLRNAFAETMLEVGQKDSRLVVMVGDISHGILQPFSQACPGRYYNVGICEPTIVGMAAGVAMSGLIPVVHTIAPFIIERAYEQIKLDFGYQKLSGHFITVGGAFDYAQLGCSHHCYTDISLMSHFKRAKIFCPGSPVEFDELFKQVHAQDGIHYFRLPEIPHGVVFEREKIRVGQGLVVRKGSDISLFCFGSILKTALSAAEQLSAEGIGMEIVYFPTIQPFDNETAQASLAKTKKALVVEECSAHDGLFNRVLKAGASIGSVRYEQMAIEDFVHGYGSYEHLCEKMGFTAEGICKRVKNKLLGS